MPHSSALPALLERPANVAPIAISPPDPATASALARVQRQIENWPAAAEPDLTQRARNLLLIAGFVFLILRGLTIAMEASTLFARLMAGAVTMIFFTYAFVNMGMVSGILPVVGVPLPMGALVDQFYADVQSMGGARQDTSSLIRRLAR